MNNMSDPQRSAATRTLSRGKMPNQVHGGDRSAIARDIRNRADAWV